jgi:hypothetical protein
MPPTTRSSSPAAQAACAKRAPGALGRLLALDPVAVDEVVRPDARARHAGTIATAKHPHHTVAHKRRVPGQLADRRHELLPRARLEVELPEAGVGDALDLAAQNIHRALELDGAVAATRRRRTARAVTRTDARGRLVADLLEHLGRLAAKQIPRRLELHRRLAIVELRRLHSRELLRRKVEAVRLRGRRRRRVMHSAAQQRHMVLVLHHGSAGTSCAL